MDAKKNTLLQLIAIKVNKGSVGGRKLSSDEPYYFLDGYLIIDDIHLKVNKSRWCEASIYDDYFSGKSPSIHISAIVGENGSGKSTVVEYMMRIINNFAAATLGEYSSNQRSYEHLHFIDGLMGSLYFRKDDTVWEIKIHNRNVQLIDYVCVKNNGDWHELVFNGTTAFGDNEEPKKPDTESGVIPFSRWDNKNRTVEEIYNALFYTYISNYSIYAYNTSDYEIESNNVTYERKCRRMGSVNKRLENDDCNWLHGLFHKNDGYQCPIVLSPYRHNGNIDINSEFHLSKERLLSLLVSSPNGFSVLNGHLKAVRFKMTRRPDVFDAAYLKRGRKEDRLYTRINAIGWSKLRQLVPKMWSDVYGLELENYKEKRTHYIYALDYLTYKTLKISAQYPQYHQFYNKHKNVMSRIDEKMLQGLVRRLSVDYSHITRKIRQILAYLVYGIYDNGEEESFEVFIQSEVAQQAAKVMKVEREKRGIVGAKRIIFSFDDLVPPPIYEVDIKLQDLSEAGHGDIPFETLSSGEKQQAFTISAVLYHLSNLESIFDDGNRDRITYSHCNVVLEELELYFHPELQKNLVRYLLDGIRQMHFSRITAINVCMVTHSPFILSDIQSKNILALNKSGGKNRGLCTFGANIHDLLKTSFLHNSVIGDYAQWIINRIIILLQVYRCLQDGVWSHKITREYWFLKSYLEYLPQMKNGKHLSFNREKIEKDFPADYIYTRIMTIDEPIIRMSLLDEYKNVFGGLTTEQDIKVLTRRIEELKLRAAKS